MRDNPERLIEMREEERSARSFGITIEQLRQQRREYGQLLTGPYAGCSPGFASMMETSNQLEGLFAELWDFGG